MRIRYMVCVWMVALCTLGAAAVDAGCGNCGDKEGKKHSHKKKEMKKQKQCPVTGKKVNKDIFEDHKGKRIYFCSKKCRSKFKRDPEKYINKMKKHGVSCEKVCSEKECAVISTGTLATLIESDTDMVILDARTKEGYQSKRIPGAVSLPSNSTEKEIREAVESKDKLIVVYCTNLKCPASTKLAKKMKKMGYGNILEYSAGVDAWEKAGHEVASSEK